MGLVHIRLVARDTDTLAAFYVTVFKCVVLRQSKMLSGEKVPLGNGLAASEICTIRLKLPECETPFLELHRHGVTHDRSLPQVNEPRAPFFATEDLRAALSVVIDAGVSWVGEITNFGSEEKPLLIAYARDPEGDIVELEQTCGQTSG